MHIVSRRFGASETAALFRVRACSLRSPRRREEGDAGANRGSWIIAPPAEAVLSPPILACIPLNRGIPCETC